MKSLKIKETEAQRVSIPEEDKGRGERKKMLRCEETVRGNPTSNCVMLLPSSQAAEEDTTVLISNLSFFFLQQDEI